MSQGVQGGASRAWYGASVSDFLAESDDAIVGRLTTASQFDIQLTQVEAWRAEIGILRRALEGLSGHLYLKSQSSGWAAGWTWCCCCPGSSW